MSQSHYQVPELGYFLGFFAEYLSVAQHSSLAQGFGARLLVHPRLGELLRVLLSLEGQQHHAHRCFCYVGCCCCGNWPGQAANLERQHQFLNNVTNNSPDVFMRDIPTTTTIAALFILLLNFLVARRCVCLLVLYVWNMRSECGRKRACVMMCGKQTKWRFSPWRLSWLPWLCAWVKDCQNVLAEFLRLVLAVYCARVWLVLAWVNGLNDFGQKKTNLRREKKGIIQVMRTTGLHHRAVVVLEAELLAGIFCFFLSFRRFDQTRATHRTPAWQHSQRKQQITSCKQ